MQTLPDYLQDDIGPEPEAGQMGAVSDWLPFCDFKVASGQVCVCDPVFSPPQADMEVMIDLQAGDYLVEGRGIAYGSDRRVAGLRCLRTGRTGLPGDVLGKVGVDTGQIGLCDSEAFGSAAAKLDDDEFNEKLESIESNAEVFELEPGVAMPVVRSGFGDGSYQVTELLDGRERVGFEVLLIVESEPYPFGKESTTVSSDDNPASSTSDAVNNFLGEMLAKIQQVKEGNAADKKEAFKSAMAELVREQEEKFRAQAEEFREFLLKHRQSAPVVETRVHSHTDDLSGDPQIASRRALLESAGYRFLGSYVFDGIPGFVLLLFLHDQNGTVASISSGKDINTEFEADYPDGIGFHVRDTAPVPGLTQPPWATYRYEIGKSVPELMAAFETHRPPGHVMFTEPEAVADLTNDFERSQSWRLDRGGWTRAEVRTQMGIGDGTGREDELTEACLAVREKWLYAWFRKCHPAIAGQYRDGLVIVHDELDSTFTYMLWAIGGGSLKVRRREFEGRPATAAFREVNQANACPLKLVAQKSEGYRADFYLPAELVGDRDA